MALSSAIPPLNHSKTLLLNRIKKDVNGANDEQILLYESVDAELAEAVLEELDSDGTGGSLESITHRVSYNSLQQSLKLKVKLNKIHDSHQPWLIETLAEMRATQVLSPPDAQNLRILSGTTFKTFGDPYVASRKEPDQCILPRGNILPTVVVESGWSESRSQLHHDRDLWLQGGVNIVNVVIILKWTKSTASQHVRGDVEIFDLDQTTNQPRLLQNETIFPSPPPTAGAQRIPLSRRQLFGSTLPVNSNPDGIGYLNLDYLRLIADEHLRQEGFIPAV